MPAKRNDSIARRLASQMWGAPDLQRKIANGIWFFSSPSHGGYVVDTNVRPEIKRYFQAQVIYSNARSARFRISEQHFIALEEDCDAPVAEWLYPNEIITPRFQSRYATTQPFPEWKEERIQILRRSLERWHPEVLKEYPVPGVFEKTN